MLLVDENVGDSALASLLLESVLDLSAVGQLIKLNEVVLDALVLEEILGLDAEGAAALGVDNDLVFGDSGIDLGG